MMRGRNIIGFQTRVNLYRVGEDIRETTVLVENHHGYVTGMTDLVDCLGNPIFKDTGILCLLGYYGFGEARTYRCVNSAGEEVEIDYETFKSMTEADKLIGTYIRNEGYPEICKVCKNQLYREE
jgi:hypothetical protein